MAHITFHGAAETVTGSKYLLQAGGQQILVDCGLFQGLKPLRQRNWDALPFSASAIRSVVLTHAHLDHTGYLPRLVRSGFRGTIYGTPATLRLAELILLDSAINQERDADYANRRGFTRHKPAQPLYTQDDARRAMAKGRAVERGGWFDVARGICARYHDAGHLLGSSMVQLEVDEPGQDSSTRLLFSGDVGRYDGPLYHDPQPPTDCDVLVCESTYGGRSHPPSDLLDELADVVRRSADRGGVVLVASFAVGRAQQLIYLLQVLIHDKRIPRLPVFLDSPMAVNATNIYYDYRADHDLSEGRLSGRQSVLKGPNVHFAKTVDQSKRLNRIDGPAVIISSSGMMEGGRILYHLRRRLPDSRNTVLLAGYMAAGTRGRRLKEGAQSLRIHGRDVPVRAAVEGVSGLSGHADHDELVRWLGPLKPPRHVFLTHGEPDSAAALAETLREERSWNVSIPRMGQKFSLNDSDSKENESR